MLKTLVIFDYSGTLSLGAVRFGEKDNLMKELHRSGLAGLGIVNPETFWKEIVNPSWEEGSTTSIGYGEIIYRKIRKEMPPPVSDGEIRLCASRFVDSYLGHSGVDVRWHPVLQKLAGEASVITIIATDHYAEATRYIVGFFKKLGLEALSLKDSAGKSVPRGFIVANSADLGLHKADPGFWERITSVLSLNTIQRVLIIDDFGFNEEKGDSYADRREVNLRKQKTVDLLKNAFNVSVYELPFILSDKDETSRGDRISQVSAEVEQYLCEK